MVCKGGGGIAFKLGSDSICHNANISVRVPKNGVSKVLRIQNFPPGSLYFIIHPMDTLPHQLFS